MKKFLVLIISLVCAFTMVLSACFNSAGPSNQEPGTEQAGGNQNNQEPETPENPDDNKDDEGGEGENPENPGNPENPDDNKDDEGGDGGEPENPGNPENPDDNKDDEGGEGEEPENPGNPENPDDNKDDEGGEGEEPENPGNPENPDDNKGNEGGEGEEPEEPEIPEEPETHECTYSVYWSCNEGYHWRVSTCSEHPDDRVDFATHNYVNGRCKDCKVSSSSTYKVGDRVPDYTFNTFKSAYTDSTYSLANAHGKVVIINFWYVNCGVCVDEMPDIEDMNTLYGDDVVVLALHASGSAHASDLAVAQEFIYMNNPGYCNKTPWTNYKTIFGKDLANDGLYKKFGGDGNYPMTVVLNAEGIITKIFKGTIIDFDMNTLKFSNKLIPVVEAALKDKKSS